MPGTSTNVYNSFPFMKMSVNFREWANPKGTLPVENKDMRVHAARPIILLSMTSYASRPMVVSCVWQYVHTRDYAYQSLLDTQTTISHHVTCWPTSASCFGFSELFVLINSGNRTKENVGVECLTFFFTFRGWWYTYINSKIELVWNWSCCLKPCPARFREMSILSY